MCSAGQHGCATGPCAGGCPSAAFPASNTQRQRPGSAQTICCRKAGGGAQVQHRHHRSARAPCLPKMVHVLTLHARVLWPCLQQQHACEAHAERQIQQHPNTTANLPQFTNHGGIHPGQQSIVQAHTNVLLVARRARTAMGTWVTLCCEHHWPYHRRHRPRWQPLGV